MLNRIFFNYLCPIFYKTKNLIWCKVSCEYSTKNKKLTLADTEGNTQKMSYQWNFPQTKRLMNSLDTLSFLTLVMGFGLPPPYLGFLHSSHWPSHWCCHNLLTTKFSFYFNLVHVVLDVLRTWHKKKVPTSNLIECTLLTPRIYLKAKS